MYEDIQLTIRVDVHLEDQNESGILECLVIDYSNNKSFTQAQPKSDKVINNVLKLY